MEPTRYGAAQALSASRLPQGTANLPAAVAFPVGVAAQLAFLNAACLAHPKQAAPRQAALNQADQSDAALRMVGINAACPRDAPASRRTSLVERQSKPGPGEQPCFSNGMCTLSCGCDITLWSGQDVTLLASLTLTSSFTYHLS